MKQLKPKFCRNCLDQFQPYKSTDTLCSFQCSVAYKEKQEIEERFKKAKQSIKYDNAKKTLQELVNKIVRLIDRGHNCITSNKAYGSYTVHAGHFYSVGAYPSLRYNLLNIYAQADYENTYNSGNGVIYSIRLKDVFGEEIKAEIDGLIQKYPTLKLSNMEAWEACKRARNIIKGLESVETIFTNEMRITMRKRLNESLGIYK